MLTGIYKKYGIYCVFCQTCSGLKRSIAHRLRHMIDEPKEGILFFIDHSYRSAGEEHNIEKMIRIIKSLIERHTTNESSND